MATPKKVIREYHSDDSFKKRYNIYRDVTEYQLCLEFARDSGEGNFTAQWDTEKVNSAVIKKFKENCVASNLQVKVFVSIGGNDTFIVDGANDWIANATDSLLDIIKKYHVDGIDVNYSKFDSNKNMFVKCIKQLIQALRQARTGFVASLAPNDSTDDDFYLPLYKAIDDTCIDTVVFQCFDDFKPDTANPVKSLMTRVQKIAEIHYTRYGTQVLVGYSAIKGDWDKVSLPIFFLALDRLILSLSTVTGASVKVLGDTQATFPATWIPQYLSWAGSVPRP